MRPADYPDVLDIDDPTPGDPAAIRAVARRWSDVAEDARYAYEQLDGWLRDEAVATWIGQAGDAFAERSNELPGQLRKTYESYELASDALSSWATALGGHQDDADHQLSLGRAAKSDLEAAQVQLDEAQVAAALAGGAGPLTFRGDASSPHAPTTDQVQAAQNRLTSANSAQANAQGLVDDAQSRLDAARRLAIEAGQVRESDGRVTAGQIDDASDAGIEERSRWEKFKDAVGDAWDVIIVIAKVVVAVLGIVALIIGGPLAWVVFAAALLVLADTLMKYAAGEASLLDVGLALLDCIPGTKGLTTLGDLATAYRAGGVLNAVRHVGVSARTAVVALGRTANTVRRGLVPSVQMSVRILGREGALAFPQLRTTLGQLQGAFSLSNPGSPMRIADAARSWQGTQRFPGVDDVSATILHDVRLEAGFPGLGNYATDAGTAASHGHDASAVWEGLQVGPQDAASRYPGYRGSMVELHVVGPTPAATGTVAANPQYGAGGDVQYYLNDINESIAAGDINVIRGDGTVVDIPAGSSSGDVSSILGNEFGNTGPIQLNGAGSANPGVASQQATEAANPGLRSGQGDLPDLASLNDLGNVLRGIGLVDNVVAPR